MSRASASLTLSLGMAVIGSTAGGSWIQRIKLSGVFFITPPMYDRCAMLVSGEVEHEIGQLEGRANKAYGGFGTPSPTDNQRKVEWVVRAPSGSTLHIAAHAERAGTVRTDVALQAEN